MNCVSVEEQLFPTVWSVRVGRTMVFSMVFITSFHSSFRTLFRTVFSQILANRDRLERRHAVGSRVSPGTHSC